MIRLPGRAMALAALVGAVSAPANGAAQHEFSDSIEVREFEIRFDASVLPRLESIGRREDADFLVTADGAELPRVATTSARAPATTALARTLWFDPDFARPRELAGVARALAAEADALVGGGEVELVAVRPPLRRRFGGDDAATLAGTLQWVAARWESDSDAPASAARRDRALDRLALDRFERRSAAGALVVAVGSVPSSFAELDRLSRLERDALPPEISLPRVEEVARIVAASGWTVFAFAARRPPDPASAREASRGAESTAIRPKNEPRFPKLNLFWRRLVPTAQAAAAFDVALDLSLSSWKPLARAGAGALVGEPRALVERLARLASRRSLVVRPPIGMPGSLQRLDVRWIGGDGRSLPAVRWYAAGTPGLLAAARLRTLAAGDLETGAATSARIEPQLGGTESTRICLPNSSGARWIRLSKLAAGGDPVSMIVGPALPLAPGAAPCVALCQPGAEGSPCPGPNQPGDLLLLEDVDSGAWAVARVAV